MWYPPSTAMILYDQRSTQLQRAAADARVAATARDARRAARLHRRAAAMTRRAHVLARRAAQPLS